MLCIWALPLVHFSGAWSNIALHPGSQKKYLMPLYSLTHSVLVGSTSILQTGSSAMIIPQLPLGGGSWLALEGIKSIA